MKKNTYISTTQIYKIVGKKEALLKELIEFIEKNYEPQIKQTFSKKNGWTVFFRKGGKSLLYINLKDGGFIVTIVIGISLNSEVKNAKLSTDAQEKFEKAKQFYDGKWLFFDIQNKRQIEDIKTLLRIKKNPIKRV